MFNNKKKSDDSWNSGNQTISTIIGEGCLIEGKVTVTDYIKIDGVVNNDVDAKSGIILSAQGRIKGNIIAGELVVFGIIEGNVECQSITIKTTGKVFGNITSKNLSIEDGAIFKGTVEMNE
jgi:cytoskeletal protein CcmA (bactofilin family)